MLLIFIPLHQHQNARNSYLCDHFEEINIVCTTVFFWSYALGVTNLLVHHLPFICILQFGSPSLNIFNLPWHSMTPYSISLQQHQFMVFSKHLDGIGVVQEEDQAFSNSLLKVLVFLIFRWSDLKIWLGNNRNYYLYMNIANF